MTTPPRYHDDDSDYDERFEEDYDTASPDDDGWYRMEFKCPYCSGEGNHDDGWQCTMCNGTGYW